MADASLSPQGHTHGFFARLQPRERRLIFALVIVFFGFVDTFRGMHLRRRVALPRSALPPTS